MSVPSPETLEHAAARLEEIAPGYLDRIRGRAAELGIPRTPRRRAERAVDLVVETARIDPNAPIGSHRRSGRVAKRVVGTLIRFYVLSVTDQVSDLGESVSWMGTALCDYVAALEDEVAALSERVDRLEGRLEQAQGHP